MNTHLDDSQFQKSLGFRLSGLHPQNLESRSPSHRGLTTHGRPKKRKRNPHVNSKFEGIPLQNLMSSLYCVQTGCIVKCEAWKSLPFWRFSGEGDFLKRASSGGGGGSLRGPSNRDASVLLTVELFLLTVRLFYIRSGNINKNKHIQFADGGGG